MAHSLIVEPGTIPGLQGVREEGTVKRCKYAEEGAGSGEGKEEAESEGMVFQCEGHRRSGAQV